MAVLTASNVTKHFGKTEALRGADIHIDAGEMVAVMGPSGSGKSTLLHCLAGILRPDSGSVLFEGEDMARLSDDDRSVLRRRRFGFVFQFGQLIADLSAVENVALPLLLDRASQGSARRRSVDWLDRLGVGHLADQPPTEMSGGEAQRVAIARAMVTEPSVVFADEPTGSLDSLAGEKVMELLTDVAHNTGTAVVLVTHDVRVAAFAGREVVVRDGRTATTVAP